MRRFSFAMSGYVRCGDVLLFFRFRFRTAAVVVGDLFLGWVLIIGKSSGGLPKDR